MTRRTATLLLGLVAAALAPTPAAAQLAVSSPLGVTGAERVTILTVQASGSVVVEWQAHPATCAAHGRCDTSGTTTWRLPSTGSLALYEGRASGARFAHGRLSLADPGDGDGTLLAGRSRRGSELCADAVASGPEFAFEERDGLMTIGLPGPAATGGLVETRCPGPLTADIAPALPTLRVPTARLRRGNVTLRLEGSGGFAAAGLRGTATATVRLKVGRALRSDPGGGDAGSEGRRRIRFLTSAFRVTGLEGDVAVDLAGGGDCAALTSCGVVGTQRFVPALTRGEAALVAYALGRKGRRAVRAAVGLAPGGVGSRVAAFGVGEWEGPGRVEVSLGRAGEAPCTDTAPLARGVLELEPRGTRVRVAYDPALAGVGRTRCAGPLLRHDRGLAVGELPLRAFGRRRVVLRLTGARSLVDDGWTGRSRPALTVVLERTRVTEQTFAFG